MSAAPKKSEAPSSLSLGVAAVSGALIAALVGYLVFHALQESAPPAIGVQVAIEKARAAGADGYVPVDVRNAGDLPASAVEIEVQFGADREDGVVQRTQIDFLAGGETRRVWVIGPAGAAVTARVVGYQEP